MLVMAVEAAKAASDNAPVWLFFGTVLAALIAAGGSTFAIMVQRKTSRQQAVDKKESDLVKKEEATLRSNVSAQVDLTKDVLDNWKDIVANLGTQISTLHSQVESLEERERKCQLELMSLKAKFTQLEGRMNSRRSEGS